MPDRDRSVKTLETLAAARGLTVKGKASRYLAVNGNMYAFVAPDGAFAFRVAKEEREAYGADWGADPVLQYGSVMRDYVAVPDALMADAAALDHWFDRSVAYANSLKPKPTKKPKK